jgi:2-phospho-L-lactate guanylyltransferase
MNTWVIIPVKPLKRAKSRLADALTAEQRHEFAALMYRQVLAVAQAAQGIAGILVISRDTQALAIARDAGVKTIQESSPSELNPALHRAMGVAKLWRAESTLILPADLPFLTVTDLEAILALGRDLQEGMVIATDKDRDGTNAMLVKPPDVIAFEYGDGSFSRHMASAQAVGVEVREYASETIALDIDTVDDLHAYNRMVLSGAYGQALHPFLPNIPAT